MENKEEIKRLYKLYLEGRTTAEQEKTLFSYLRKHRIADKELDDLLKVSWADEPAPRDDSEEAGQGFENILDKIGQRSLSRKRQYGLLKFAASVVLVIAGGLAGYQYKQQHRQTEATQTAQLITRHTQPGEKVRLLLPDSTIVYLGGGSKLTWPARFAAGQGRNIRLEGEAFFEVKQDAGRPFSVQSGNIRTQVLGTSFNIYSYPSDGQFRVLVKSGKVGIHELANDSSRQLSLLTAGMELTYNRKDGRYAVNRGRAAEAGSWTENRFVFRDEPLDAMLQKLERYYKVRLVWKGSPASDCRMNATFDNKSIKEVMEQLQIMSSGRMSYQFNADKTLITLGGEVCQ